MWKDRWNLLSLGWLIIDLILDNYRIDCYDNVFSLFYDSFLKLWWILIMNKKHKTDKYDELLLLMTNNNGWWQELILQHSHFNTTT